MPFPTLRHPSAPEQSTRHTTRRSLLASLAGLTLAGALVAPSTPAAQGATDPGNRGAARAAAGGANGDGNGHRLQRAPIDRLSPAVIKAMKRSALRKPVGVVSTTAVTVPAGHPVDPIELRVLVLATKGDPNPNGVGAVPSGSWDWALSTATTAMDYAGIPYDTYLATTKQLCVGGTWRLDWTTGSPTSSSCSTGNVVDWGGITADKLWDGQVHAYYQGVIQTNGTLSYVDPSGVFVNSALTTDEWTALWTFEAQFGLRSASLVTYPTADFGLAYKGEDGNGATATWTSAGRSAFPYVNGTGTLPISNAWIYRASVDPLDTTTTTLLTDSAADALAVVHKVANQGNREVLALTTDSAGYLLHGEVLGYGVVSWVTKGLFLGERHAYLTPEPDDLYIADSIWSSTTQCSVRPDDPSLPQYRITGADVTSLASWESQRSKPAISKAFRIEFPYNGEGTTAGYLADLGITRDTLVPAVKKYAGQFAFLNHTWSHQNMDQRQLDVTAATANGVTTLSAAAGTFVNSWGSTVIGSGIASGSTVVDVNPDGSTITLSAPGSLPDGPASVWVGVTYTQASSEISQNASVAASLGLTTVSTNSLVQPDISGLGNPNFLQAANDNGIRYLISDTSRTGDPNSYGVNEGTVSSGSYDPTQLGGSTAAQSGWQLLEVARYPVNLYFNVRDPGGWVAEDHCLYPSGSLGYVADYSALLDRESTTLVRYLLQGHNRPLMFHQPNVAAYDGKRSLLGDLMDATLSKYSQLVTAPIQSPTLDQLGVLQVNRMTYNKALASGALTASIVPGKTITVANSGQVQVKVPVTGLNAGSTYGTEKYAGQNISYLTLAPGASLTLPLK